PTLVPGTWLDVAAGGNTTCALTTGNAAYCWGDNEYGQVGDGSSNGSFSVPTSVYGGHTFMKIAVGGSHSCAINDSSELWCWGRGVSGQLGDSTFNSYSEPVQEA